MDAEQFLFKGLAKFQSSGHIFSFIITYQEKNTLEVKFLVPA